MSDTKTAQDYLALGQTALKTAAWSVAKTAFEKALSLLEMPDAHDGLGIALWWLNEIDMAHQHRIRAYNGFKDNGLSGRAALIACWLAREQMFLHSNFSAMQGWFARAERLLEHLPPGLEHAWFAILRATMLAETQEMLFIAPQVIITAHNFKNSHLEAFTLAFYGQALVIAGRVGEGMAHLDEAMTMATGGETTDFTIISEIFCVMLSACEVAGDLTRSNLWCQMAAEFAQRHSCPFLSAYCRTAYGGMMTALGRWQEAETALLEAIQAFEQGHKGLRIHAVIKLADLRVYQGKIEEAEVMLAGMEDQKAAVIPLARLCLKKGETALARAILEQVLPASISYTLNHLPALLLMMEILLTMNDTAGIQQVITHLMTLSGDANSPLLTAQIEFIRGRVSFQAGDFVAAKTNFRTALAYLQSYEQSLLAGQIKLGMAQMLQTSDVVGAEAWAKAALATFERIGAEHDSAIALALLRQLGVARSTAPRWQKPLTKRETEIVSLIAAGLTNRDIAARLVISTKTVEHHVSRILDKLDLRSRAEIAAFAVSGKIADIVD